MLLNSIKIDWECKCDEILFDKIVIESICAEAVMSTEQLVEPNGNKREPDLLRVHIDRYTAVIQKKPVLLKDALQVYKIGAPSKLFSHYLSKLLTTR